MDWNEIEALARMLNARVKSVYQEEMQKAILTSLSRKGCFDHIVFHGGTALRLFHGNPRFSEDIDLVLREGYEHFDLSRFATDIERTCFDTFPFLQNVNVKVQKDTHGLQRYILKASSEDTRQNARVHIEVADVPSYRNGPRVLNFPPFQPAVRVEDEVEILADKVRALGYRSFLKGRDLWDIYFLSTERSAGLDIPLVARKIRDYNEDVNEIEVRYDNVKRRVREDGLSILSSEMDRYLPKQVLDSYRPIYESILNTVIELISRFEGAIGSDGHEDQ